MTFIASAIASVSCSETPDGLSFTYDDAWAAAARPRLSHSLPLTGGFSTDTVRSFFAGLLPEGEPRRLLARRLGIAERDDFAMLAAIGGDCSGAISVLRPGHSGRTGEQGSDVRWLDDDDLITLIETLPDRPMLASEDGEIRLSLAGAQDKLPVVFDDDGRVGITTGITPSTHILKTPITRLSGTVVNEAFCLGFGARLGIPTAVVAPRRVKDREYLLVTRYDRVADGDRVHRLHQEDFCQALGVPPEGKYQANNGPALPDCFELVREATSPFAANLQHLLDGVALNFLVGNHDAHAKNFSLLYRPGGGVGLAPLYDILSTIAYPGLARKMAMKIGGEYRPDYVRSRHLERMLAATELGPRPARRRIEAMAQNAPAGARAVRAEFAASGWDHDILDAIIAVIDRRAAQLGDITTAAPT